MQLNMTMVDIMTDPVKFREYMKVAIHNHEQQKKAKRDWYNRNKDAIRPRGRSVKANTTIEEMMIARILKSNLSMVVFSAFGRSEEIKMTAPRMAMRIPSQCGK